MDVDFLKQIGVSEENIPKLINEFDMLAKENESFKSQLDQNQTRLKELESFKGTNEELTQTLNKVRLDFENARNQYAKDIESERKNAAVRYALGTMKDTRPHDTNMVLGLLDFSKIQMDSKGEIESGLNEQLENIKRDKSFLFTAATQQTTQGNRKGTSPSLNYMPKPQVKDELQASIGTRIAKKFARGK